jgi:tRNA-modifying protein YgfZ
MNPAAFWCEWPRDFVDVAGPDAEVYLQSQLSQDIGSLPVGGATWSFLLQPNGKVDALVRVTRLEDLRFVLDVDGGFGAAVLVRLERFRIRVKVEMEPLAWRCLAVRGPGVREQLAAAGSPAGGWWVTSWWADPAALDAIGPAPIPPAELAEGDLARLEAVRIESGWPAVGVELTERTIPGELGPLLELAVSFTKGCYPGQELVERMHSRGAVAPRQLRRIRSDGPALATGAPIVVGAEEVGAITSSVGVDALALVARAVEPVARGQVGGVDVSILPLR